MKYVIGSMIGVLIIGGIFFFSSGEDANKNQGDASRTDSVVEQKSKSDFDVFAGFVLPDYEGNNIPLADFKGKPLVINSWAVWCPFCREELPAFGELQKEFGDQVVVIAIDRQEPLEKAKGYTDGLGISSDMLFLLDSSDSFYKSIGGFSMPETIFVDSDGNIVVHKRGPMDLDEMREHTQKIIGAN